MSSPIESPQETADKLLLDLNSWVGERELDEIWLVGHSNGGLIARQMVENLGGGNIGGARITRVVTLDSPDRGVLLGEVSDMNLPCQINVGFTKGLVWNDYVGDYLDRDNNKVSSDWLDVLPTNEWMSRAGILQYRFVYGDPVLCVAWSSDCTETSGNIVVSHQARANEGSIYLTNDLISHNYAVKAEEEGDSGRVCQSGGYGFLATNPTVNVGFQHLEGHDIHHEIIRDIIFYGPASPTVAANAKERGEVYVNCYKELAKLRDDLGPNVRVDVATGAASTAIDSSGPTTSNDFQDVRVEMNDRELKATVRRDDHRGATLTFQLDEVPAGIYEYEVRLDGAILKPAESYEDILDPNDDGDQGEYLLVTGANSHEMLVSVPHFSERVITIRMIEEGLSDNQGEGSDENFIPVSPVAVLLALGILLLAYRKRREG